MADRFSFDGSEWHQRALENVNDAEAMEAEQAWLDGMTTRKIAETVGEVFIELHKGAERQLGRLNELVLPLAEFLERADDADRMRVLRKVTQDVQALSPPEQEIARELAAEGFIHRS